MLKGRFQYLALPLFLIGVVLIVFLQFVSGNSINNLIHGNKRLLNDLNVQSELQRLETDVIALESDVRGLVITGDTIHSMNVEQNVRLIRSQLVNISKLITDTDGKILMDSLADLVQKKVDFSYENLSKLRVDGKAAAETQINSNYGKFLRDSIINVMHKMDNLRQSEVRNHVTVIDDNGQKARTWGLIIAIIACGICVLAFWHFVSQGQHQRRLIMELDASEKQVKQSAKVKEQFLANMSHELRTPMNAILGFTNLLKKSELQAVQKQYVDNIQSSSENLLAIVNDILDLSKIEAGMMQIEAAPFSLYGLIHSVETMFGEKARKRSLYLKVDLEEGMPDVLNGDAVRLTQILVNLLGNAIKFTAAGGITLSVKAVEKSDKHIRLQFCIQDTGIGIARDKQKAIFERFQQAETETTRRYGGSGLGLSIVKQLVDLQDGTVKLKSELNKGTEFIFEIPYTIATGIEAPVQYIEEPSVSGNPSGIKILVAEDNMMNQQLMKHLLQNWKIEFAIARNGVEAVKALENEKFDLVLMDIQMPEMDGYIATQKIREEMDLQVPIIAMTAHAMAGEKEKCISFGMNDYLSKPITESELYGLIARYADAPHDGQAQSGNMINLDYLKEISRGNQEFEKEIIKQFISQVPQEIETLEKAVEEKDFKIIAQTAHSLKSSVAYLGLKNELEPLLDEIETQCSNGGDISIINSSFTAVKSTCSSAVKQAKKLVESYN